MRLNGQVKCYLLRCDPLELDPLELPVVRGIGGTHNRHRAALYAGRPVQPKNRNAYEVFDLDSTVLYRLAALPDGVAAALTPDTLLTDPRTGRQVPLKDMSAGGHDASGKAETAFGGCDVDRHDARGVCRRRPADHGPAVR